MNFKPNPLLYGTNEDFISTFRLAIRMKDTVDYNILYHAVEKAMVRYPYFCVFSKRENANLVLRFNDSPICDGEYSYSFPDSAINSEKIFAPSKEPQEAYGLDAVAFDAEGLYAYHLHVPQKDMMEKASTSDGSPVSFISVLLYRALHHLDSNIDKPVVAHVQHQ